MPSPQPVVSIPMEIEIRTPEIANQILTAAFNEADALNYDAAPYAELKEKLNHIIRQFGEGLGLLQSLYETDEYDNNYAKIASFFIEAARKLFQRGKLLKLTVATRNKAINFFKLSGKHYENYIAHCENKYDKVSSDFHCLRLSAYVNIIHILKDTNIERQHKYKQIYVEYFEKNLLSTTDVAECYQQTYEEYLNSNPKRQPSGKKVTIPENPDHKILGNFTLKRPILLKFFDNTKDVLLTSSNPADMRVENTKSVFMKTIKTFTYLTQAILNRDQGITVSNIMLHLAQIFQNDLTLKKIVISDKAGVKKTRTIVAMLFVTQSIYEASAALSNSNASTALNKFRLDNNITFGNSSLLRVSDKLRISRTNIPKDDVAGILWFLKKMYQEIDHDNMQMLSNKIDIKNPSAYSIHLENFFDNLLDELEVLFPEKLKLVLAHILGMLGQGFQENKIAVVGCDSAQLADLFLKQAIHLKTPAAMNHQVNRDSDVDEQFAKKARF